MLIATATMACMEALVGFEVLVIGLTLMAIFVLVLVALARHDAHS